ncbi:MAG: hypothetical protein J7J88_00385 [Dehalococcoidia bacterium]|nr:hypothetical protein [Dehalococcoidia bacterium]
MPRARVKKVIDGDTIEIMNGARIRIADYDAPELDEYGGKAAKKHLSEILRGKEIGISGELAKSYGRSVRQVTVGGKPVKKLMRKKR